MYNPIIPVSRSLPKAWRGRRHGRPSGYNLAREYIRVFEPDVFVETEQGLAKSVGVVDSHPRTRPPRVISLDDLVSSSDSNRFIFGLDIFYVYRHLYHTEYQFVRRRNRVITSFQGESRHSAYIDATFGGFPTSDALSYIPRAYEQAFNLTTLQHLPSNWITVIGEYAGTPLGLTCHAITPRQHASDNLTIFLADPRSPVDLMDLWNTRLLRRNVISVNSEWLPELKDYLRDLVAHNNRPVPRGHHEVMPRTTIDVGSSFSEEAAEHIVHDTFAGLPSESWLLSLTSDEIWRRDHLDQGRRISPIQIESESFNMEIPVKDSEYRSIQIRSLAPKFAPEYGSWGMHWANVLSLRDYGSRNRLALDLPSTLLSTPYDHLRLGGLFVNSREGFVLPQRYKDHREYLQLMSGTEAIIDWFKRHGLTGITSESGQISEQILSSVGGVYGIGILQDPGTLHLLNKMSRKLDRIVTVEEWKETLNRRGDGSTTAFLDRLVEIGALKLGLSVSCPNCRKRNWYSLDNLAETIPCERCMKDFAFPQGSLSHKNPPWMFRVAGPYSVPNYANGAYANVLALSCLANESMGDTSVTFSTNLEFTGLENPMEIDFACWLRNSSFGADRRDDPAFLVGEAKSFGNQAFSNEDVVRLKRIAKCVPGTFLVLAILKDTLNDRERSLIGRLATWGRVPDSRGNLRAPVIVLTGTELFAKYGVSTAWNNTEGERKRLSENASFRLTDPRTLADLTQQVYLGLPPTYRWLQEYRSRIRQRRTPRDASTGSGPETRSGSQQAGNLPTTTALRPVQ